jgi:biotin transporter BioY
LIDAVLPADDIKVRIARDILFIVGFSLLVALLARISVHTPFSPVPITGQTLAVLLTGAALGSWRGAAALGLYLVAGSQFSVYAGSSGDYIWQTTSSSYIFGFTSGSSGLFWELASGGYIIGFIPAAFLVGYLCEHGWDRKVWIILAMLAGNVLLYVPGLIQLSLFVPNDKVLDFGLYPFIAGDLIKLYIAALAVPVAWQLLNLRRRDNRWT